MNFRTYILLPLLLAGISRADAGAELWRQVAQPTHSDLLRLSFLDSARGWAVGRQGTILKTSDGGRKWELQDSGLDSDINCVFMLNDRLGWAISWRPFVDTLTFYGTRLLHTTNGGTDWMSTDFPVRGKYFHSIMFLDSTNGWLGGEEGLLYRTSNAGASWSKPSVDSSFYGLVPVFNIQFFSPQNGFAMGGALDYVGVIWKTTNGGEYWNVKPVSPEPVYKLHFVDSLNIIGIVGDLDYGASMIRSSDAGEHWDYRFLEIFGQPRAMSFRTPNEGWVSLGTRFMVTTDTAHTWQVVPIAGLRRVFDVVFTDSLTGYAAADSGIILKYDSRATAVPEIAGLPSEPKLLQNFPNPFNPRTEIEYQTSEVGRVTLKVFDILGREVATLVDEVEQPGHKSVTFDAGGLASGVYFYRLSAGSFQQTRKLLLAK